MLIRVLSWLAAFMMIGVIFAACVDDKSNHQENFFYYYDLDQRLKSLETVRSAIEAKYALIDIKKDRIGVDLEDVFSTARLKEMSYLNEYESVKRAESNLLFLDRIREVVALFEDSHLRVLPLMELPTVELGFKITEVEGQFIVSSIDEGLENMLEEVGAELSIGNQVFQIDGTPVDKKSISLGRYIFSSSRSYRRKKAIESLTSRNFSYPRQAFSVITFRTTEGKISKIRLNWQYDLGYQRADALLVLRQRGFQLKSSTTNSFYGYHDHNVPNNLVNVQEWYDQEGGQDLVLRTGFIKQGSVRFGLLQLFSFHNTQIVEYETGTPFLWDQPIIDFLRRLERKKIPLVLDLRFNEGGHVDAPVRLASLLAKDGESYPSFMEGFRITRNIQQIWQRILPNQQGELFGDRKTASQIRKAVTSGRKYTGMWPRTLDIEPPTNSRGFNQPLVVLISESCISACDIFALLMETSNRALLIGRPTNGTGAGYFDWHPYSGSSWVDMDEIFQFEIPNMLFGHSLNQGPLEFPSERATMLFNRENRPVNPHKIYVNRREDILLNHKGWFDFTVDSLEHIENIRGKVVSDQR